MLSLRSSFALLLVLAPCSQIFRVENEITVTLNQGFVGASSHLDTYHIENTLEDLRAIEMRFQRSMASETKLVSLVGNGSAGGEIALKRNCFFLFGRCLAGSAWGGSFPDFKYSFGDWTMDRTLSSAQPVWRGTLRFPAALTFRLIGRGENRIIFHDSSGKSIELGLSDGYIDNAYALCSGGECPVHAESREAVSTNLVRILAFFIEISFCGVLLIAAAALLRRIFHLPSATRGKPVNPRYFGQIAIFLAAVHFSAALYMSSKIMEETPHVSDSAVYYRQAILLSEGGFRTAPVPFPPIEAYLSNGSRAVNGAIEYVHGSHFWPAMLGLAIKLKAPFALAPLLSSLTVLLIFSVGRRFVSEGGALAGALFYALSPFPLVMAGDYLLHPATCFFLMLSLACLVRQSRGRPDPLPLASGVCFGMALALRPLTAAAVGLAAALWLLASNRNVILQRFPSWLIGLTPVLAILFLDNFLITGQWVLAPHRVLHNITFSLSNIPKGTNYVDAMLGYLPSTIFFSPWPQLFLGLMALPIFFRQRGAGLCFSAFLFLLGAYAFVNVHGLHGYGPRFLFEVLPALFLLAGEGAFLLYSFSSTKAYRTLVVLFFTVLIAVNAAGLWTILPRYRNYNGIEAEKVRHLRAFDNAPRLYLMKGTNWQSMDSAATLFDPHFKHRIFIHELPDHAEQRIIEHFRDWHFTEVRK